MDYKFKKNFLKGSAAATLGQASSMLFHFLSIMLLTRVLGVFEFGIFSLSLAITYLFNTISSLGLEVTLVKFISSDNTEEKTSAFVPTIVIKFFSTTFIALIFFAASKLILPMFGKGLEEYALLINIMFVLGSYRDHFFNLFQGLNLFKKYAIVQSTSAASRVIAILILIWFNEVTLYNVLLIEILTTLISLSIQLLNVPFKEIIHPFNGYSIYKKIFKFCMPIYLNNLFMILYGRANYFIIAAYLNPASVAYYDVAAKIPEAIKKLFDSFILVYFPNLSKLLSRGEIKQGESLMNKSLGTISVVITLLVFFSFIFQKEIILILFSEKYLESSMALSLLMLNFQFRSTANIMGYSILSAGYPAVSMRVNAVSSIISIAGSLLMIPIWGFIGSVYALLLMNTVAQIQYFIKLKKIPIKTSITKLLQPLFIMAVFLMIYYLLGINSLIIKILISAVYLIVNILLIKDLKNIFISFIKLIPILNKV